MIVRLPPELVGVDTCLHDSDDHGATALAPWRLLARQRGESHGPGWADARRALPRVVTAREGGRVCPLRELPRAPHAPRPSLLLAFESRHTVESDRRCE